MTSQANKDKPVTLLDCTLRDGGYYNSWDFPIELINDYLKAMQAISMDYVELGFRSLKADGFKGGCAYTTDTYVRTFDIPPALKLGVMVNASELVQFSDNPIQTIGRLFTASEESLITLVRIACHVHEFERVLPVTSWLKDNGYQVGINLMQIADRSHAEISRLAEVTSRYPVDVLYFADSLGSLNTQTTVEIIQAFREKWPGAIGIHTHDNMGYALANSIAAVKAGVTWVDSTVTGMGRGPGNARTEYTILEFDDRKPVRPNLTPLLHLIRKYFKPLQDRYGWGSNPYYYLTGKYGIHPSYIQEMLSDNRFSDTDILSAIEHLRVEGGKSFNIETLEASRQFFKSEVQGKWNPSEMIEGKEVLILGSGEGVKKHKYALENYILKNKPIVIALNTNRDIDDKFVDFRAACHPMRLIADYETHASLASPLATPASMLPEDVKNAFKNKLLFDYGLVVQPDTFEFHDNYSVMPSPLVMAYALAIATSGNAKRITLAGFDGYTSDDPRKREAEKIFKLYRETKSSVPLVSITATKFEIDSTSVYALID